MEPSSMMSISGLDLRALSLDFLDLLWQGSGRRIGAPRWARRVRSWPAIIRGGFEPKIVEWWLLRSSSNSWLLLGDLSSHQRMKHKSYGHPTSFVPLVRSEGNTVHVRFILVNVWLFFKFHPALLLVRWVHKYTWHDCVSIACINYPMRTLGMSSWS